MKNFTCQICNKKHHVYYSTTSPIPDLISNLINENSDRLKKLSDVFYIVDNQKLIAQGDIKIEIESNKDFLELTSWCSIDLQQFNANFKKLQKGEDIKMTGLLLSEFPFYKESQNLKIELMLNQYQERGIISLLQESQLKTDQLEPINDSRLVEIMQSLQHPELWPTNESEEQCNTQTLENVIQIAQDEFISSGRIFIVDISTQKQVLFQIVSSEILEEPNSKGFGLHFANDDHNSNYKEVKSKMNYLNISKTYIIDGIEIYQTNYLNNIEQMVIDINIILEEVFSLSIDLCELEILEL